MVSSASTPPAEPFQAAAVSVELVVAVVNWGTRTTWKVRWPVVAVAAACVYVLSSPAPGPVPLIPTLPATTPEVASTYS